MRLPCGMSQQYSPPHFLESYVLWCGVGKPPAPFHLWSGLSLLAAAVQDRISITRVEGKPMPPNLYVALIGPSGTGKGTAVHHAMRVHKHCSPTAQQRIAKWYGKITPQALFSYMSAHRDVRPAIWFVTPELSMALGTGTKADDFVRHFTGWYEGAEDIIDFTRMYGEKYIEGLLLINWLAASTLEWVIDSVTEQAIESGFFGRVCGVYCQRKTKVPSDPWYPPNNNQTFDYLVAYVEHLTELEGPVGVSPDARQVYKTWYDNRPQPQLPSLMPFWERQDDLVYKLAQLLAVGDHYKMTIDAVHMADAIALTDWLLQVLPYLVEHAHRGRGEAAVQVQWVADWFRRAPDAWVSRAPLVRDASKRGILAPQLNQIIATLVDRGDVKLHKARIDDRGNWYKWIGGGVLG